MHKLPLVAGHNYWKARYFVFYDGQWHGYASKWKSQFRGPKLYAATYAQGDTLKEISDAIAARRTRR